MAIETSGYGLRVRTRLGYEDALRATREALRAQGFGVLTEIDVRTTLKEKLGIEGTPYMIFGACHPGFAHQALEIEPEIGLLLPCNVIVYAVEGGSVVAAVDPEKALGAVIHNPALAGIATQVRAKLEAALTAVAQA